MKHTLLLIDDETDNLDALERVFRKKFHILKANSGPKALDILKNEPHISVIISDQRMPEMTGVEFFKKSMKTHESSIRILLTGYTDLDSVIAAINSGQVYRYVTKPWDTRELQITLDQAIEKFELESELKIKNEELKKALEELSLLDASKSQFMILINHELKTPLTTLLSFSELLKQTELSTEQTKYLQRMEKSSDRLKEIIEDSLELVSSELGQLKIQETKIHDEKIIDEVLNELSSLVSDKKPKIKLELSNKKFLSDPKILKNILKRIISNAILHGDLSKEILIRTFDSPKEIADFYNLKNSFEIKNKPLKSQKGSRNEDPLSKNSSHKELEEEAQIVFEIINSGKEIPRATIEKILKPFSLNEDIMNHSKGLGLGLSISQSLLKNLNSELAIESSQKKIKVVFAL